MSHVIAFPPAYPIRAAALDRAECVLLLGLRWWVADRRRGVDALPRLCEAMSTAGAHDAAFSVDRLMEVVARAATRQVDIRCPRCPAVSQDESHLLHAASLAQAGQTELAERALRTCLLSAQGAEFALGPLEGLGELFATAQLMFRQRRRPPVPTERWSPAVPAEVWSPAVPSQTLH